MVSRGIIPKELHPDVVQSVERQLALQRSRRAIAIATGISRKSVNLIAAGMHVSQLDTRFHRCSRGHKTTLPCRTCATLDWLAERKPSAA